MNLPAEEEHHRTAVHQEADHLGSHQERHRLLEVWKLLRARICQCRITHGGVVEEALPKPIARVFVRES